MCGVMADKRSVGGTYRSESHFPPRDHIYERMWPLRTPDQSGLTSICLSWTRCWQKHRKVNGYSLKRRGIDGLCVYPIGCCSRKWHSMRESIKNHLRLGFMCHVHGSKQHTDLEKKKKKKKRKKERQLM